jgi:hypothetical protein
MKLLPQKQHTADRLQLTAIGRPRRPARFCPHPSTLILVLALPCLLVTCSSPEPPVPARDWGKFGEVDTFPPVYLERLAPEEARRLHVTYLADCMRGAPLYRAAIARLRVLLNWRTPFREDPLDWYSASHPYLAALLPGVSIYLSPERRLVMGEGRDYFATSGGKVYDLPDDVNSLLYDCDMRFEAADIPIWARVLALLYSVGEEERRAPVQLFGEDVFEGVLAGERPLFPKMTIESMVLDTASVGNPSYWTVPEGTVHQVALSLRMGDTVSTLSIQTMAWGVDDLTLLCPYTLQRHERLPPPSLP